MSATVVEDRATVELGLLNEDPDGYAGKLGLPVDLGDLTDVELITADDGPALTLICILII